MKRSRIRPEEVVLIVPHPWAWEERPMPMLDWMRLGPGIHRPGIRPTEARHAVTGERLPLSVLPLRYRNTWLSNWLISIGLLENPWPRR